MISSYQNGQRGVWLKKPIMSSYQRHVTPSAAFFHHTFIVIVSLQHVRKAETDGQMQISAYFTGKLADGRDCSSDVEATRAAPPSPTPNTALSTTYITTLPLQSNHTGTSFCKLSISSDLGPSPVAMCLEDDSNVNAV